MQPWCPPCKAEWAKARRTGVLVPLGRRPENPETAAKREAVAAGRRHVIARVSYSEGVSLCTCGHRVEEARADRHVPRRQRRMAEAMTQHIAEANGRKPADAESRVA